MLSRAALWALPIWLVAAVGCGDLDGFSFVSKPGNNSGGANGGGTVQITNTLAAGRAASSPSARSPVAPNSTPECGWELEVFEFALRSSESQETSPPRHRSCNPILGDGTQSDVSGGELIAGPTHRTSLHCLSDREAAAGGIEGALLEEMAILIADGRAAEVADWDTAAQAARLAEFASGGLRFGASSDDAAIDALQKAVDDGALRAVAVSGSPDPVTLAVTRAGDLWLLGELPLPASSSRKAGFVARVFGPEHSQDFQMAPPDDSASQDWIRVQSPQETPNLESFLAAARDAAQPHIDHEDATGVWRVQGVIFRAAVVRAPQSADQP